MLMLLPEKSVASHVQSVAAFPVKRRGAGDVRIIGSVSNALELRDAFNRCHERCHIPVCSNIFGSLNDLLPK